MCSILPARRESNTSQPLQEGVMIIFHRKDIFAWPKKRGVEEKAMIGRMRWKTKANFPGKAEAVTNLELKYILFTSLSYALFYVSQEGSVLRADISQNSCRWLLSSGNSLVVVTFGVRVVFRKTVVSDRRFNSLFSSHFQSQCHVLWSLEECIV